MERAHQSIGGGAPHGSRRSTNRPAGWLVVQGTQGPRDGRRPVRSSTRSISATIATRSTTRKSTITRPAQNDWRSLFDGPWLDLRFIYGESP